MDLNSIFYPKAIAIIGASTEVGHVGNDIVKNLITQGYKGKIFPVNPKAAELYNLKCYPYVLAIKEKIDLAIIVVPNSIVPTVLETVAKKKIKGVIIISAGFKEVGNVDLENQIKKICQKNKIALIGPNCLGVINPENKMNASFAKIMPRLGNIAFISQSGALCTAILDYAQKLDIGFSKFVSVGNKALLSEADLFEYLTNDKKTKVVAIYVEELTNASALIAAAKKLTHGKNPKPIIAIKSGRTSDGASASASHTGALAGNDSAYQGLFSQAGIIRVDMISELFEYLRIFTHNDLPQGDRVAIVTNAGGPGVLTTDEVILSGLKMAKISEATQKKLKRVLPTYANFHNPIDVLGDAKSDRYQAAINILIADKNVDSLIVVLTPQSMTEFELTAQTIIKAKNKTRKPIVASFIGGKLVENSMRILRAGGVSTFNFPEEAAKALDALTHFANIRKDKYNTKFHFKNTNKQAVEKYFTKAKNHHQTIFPEADALPILRDYGFPLLHSEVAKNATEAEQIAKKIAKPVVLKIVSQNILHKTDAGGVMLNVEPDQAGIKFTEMIKKIKHKFPLAKIDGVLIMEMIQEKGVEMILGSVKDPGLGNTIMVGLGGTYVEIFKDVTFGLAPLTAYDAQKMINKLKSKKILDGARGQAVLDTQALVDCLGRLSQLLIDFPNIKELDINPLLVLPKGKGVRVLDARIVIE
jgi:acetyltransferase